MVTDILKEPGIPVTLFDFNKSLLFGLVRINITIIDQKAKNPARRYKHIFTVNVFGKNYISILRSSTEGFYSIEDKELILPSE